MDGNEIEERLMAIKPRSAKNKGKKFQNEICADLSLLSDIPWGDDRLIASRGMGQHGVDIILMGEAFKLFPFSFEVKNQKTWNINDDVSQAITNKKEGSWWGVIYKTNHKKAVLILDKWDFKEILSLETRLKFIDKAHNKEHLKSISLQKWIYEKKFSDKDVITFVRKNVYCVALKWKTFLKAYKYELKLKGLL